MAINSVFQTVAFGALVGFYLRALPGRLGIEQSALSFSMSDIARSVLIFLGIPLLAGILIRTLGERLGGSARVAGAPADRAVRSVPPAVHHRRALRRAGAHHHGLARRRGPHRGPAGGVLRDHVGRPDGSESVGRPELRPLGHPGVHRGEARTSSSRSPSRPGPSWSPQARRRPGSWGLSSRSVLVALRQRLGSHVSSSPTGEGVRAFNGRTKVTGQGRPSLRLAAWRAGWAVLQNAPSTPPATGTS